MGVKVSTDWRDYLLKGDEVNYAFENPAMPNDVLKDYIKKAYDAFEKKEKIS